MQGHPDPPAPAPFSQMQRDGCREKKVLVVEDSAVYRKLISDHLRAWDFTVTVAETGAEATAVLDRPETQNTYSPVGVLRLRLRFACAKLNPRSA